MYRLPAGQLTQLSFNGWNLGGTFPTDQLARFSALSELDLSNNYAMNADLKLMFDALSQLKNIQVFPCCCVVSSKRAGTAAVKRPGHHMKSVCRGAGRC